MSRPSAGLDYCGAARYEDKSTHLCGAREKTDMEDNWKRMSLRFGQIYGQNGVRLLEPSVRADLSREFDSLRETIIDEGDEGEAMDIDEEQEEGSQTRPLEPLSFRDFFGSSVDLTPSLLTIFDSYSNEEGNNNEAAPAATLSRSTLNMTDSQTAPTEDGGSKSETSTAKDVTENTTVTNGSTNNELTVANDNKKRPLSISSTSSSASSTSSLPRHRRKKANMSQVADGVISSSRVCAADHSMDTLTDEELLTDLPEEGSTAQEDDDLSHSNRSSQSVGSSLELSDPKVRHIARVVSEILETERTYCSHLEEIIEGYLAHVLEHSQDYQLSEDDTNALFGNVKEIHAFNKSFLAELCKCEEDAVQIAKCFVDHSQGFHIYTEYCTNYPRAVEVLTKCMRKTETAEVFRARQTELDHALPLGSYLLKPVQRILKYHLLLQSLLKHYDQDKAGYNDIQGAISSMTDMAKHINEMKRKHEDAVRVQELQSMLYDWTGQDLTTFGELTLESSFRMYGAKASRQIFLFKSGLVIAKKKEDGTLACKGVIMCSNLMLIESIPKEPLCFHVIPFDNPRMQYTLQARSLQQKREWCQEIKRLILESYAINIPEKAKEIVLQQLGKDKESTALESGDSVESSRVKNSAPVYLEKRKTNRRRSEFSLLKPFKATKKEGLSPRNKHEKTQSSERHRSQSLTSLDDLALESLKTVKLAECDETETNGYDDATDRAKRTNQVFDEEGAETQLEKRDGDRDQESPMRRAESFKKAVHLHRLDSKIVKPKTNSKSKLSVPRETMEMDSDSEPEEYLARGDDDYVELRFDNQHRVFPDEESLYSNIVMATRNELPTKDSIYDELKPLRESGVITNRHAEELAKWQLAQPAFRRSGNNDSREQKNSVRELKKFFSESEVRRPGLVHRLSDSNLLNNRARTHHSALESISDEPIYDVVCNSGRNRSRGSVIKNESAIYDTVPARKTSVYDFPKPQITVGDYDYISLDAARSPGPSNKFQRQNAMDTISFDGDPIYDVPASPWSRRSEASALFHSDSKLSSMSEDDVVLENPSALLASYSPPTADARERRSVIQRYATPPRTLSLDANVQSDTAEQRRAISRYATPPRELMHPDTMHLAAVMRNSFSSSNLDLNDASSSENTHAPLMSSRSVGSTPSIESRMMFSRGRCKSDDHSPLPRSTRDIWGELEKYIKMSPAGMNVPNYPRKISTSALPRSPDLLTPSSPAPTRGRQRRSYSVDVTASRRSSSTDRFVGSLRKISQNISSKLTRRLSPAPSQDSLAEDPVVKSNSDEATKTPINHIQKTVGKLARAYSRRIKAVNKTLVSRKSEGDLPVPHHDEHRLNEMLLASQPGSSTIGARIAEKQPQIVIGDYQLCRARPARPSPNIHPKSDPDKYSHSAIFSALADLSSSDSEDEGTVVAGSKGDLSLQDGVTETENYYESKLSNALEEGDLFRDSAVYSDADSPETSTNTSESEHRATARSEKPGCRHEDGQRSRSASSVETRRRPQGMGIQNRLRSLEQAVCYVKPETKIELKEGIRERLKHLEDSTRERHKSDASVTFGSDIHIPSVKDRQSMLVEEAVGERKRSSSLPPEEVCGILFCEQQAVPPKGYVKNVANRFKFES